jgi:hypothetical protein
MKIVSMGVALVFLTGLAASPALGQSIGVPSTTATSPPLAARPPTVPITAPPVSPPSIDLGSDGNVPATAPSGRQPNLALAGGGTVPATAPAGRQPNLALAGAGAAIFLATWVPAVILGSSQGGCDYQACHDARSALVVPVAGPFLATRTRANNTPEELFVAWSLVEGAGLSMFVAGIIGHHPAAEKRPTSRWDITPVASRDATGFILHATF